MNINDFMPKIDLWVIMGRLKIKNSVYIFSFQSKF